MANISAIIPVFNGTTRYLQEAIQSILSQTLDNWELIIVDDGSEDNTLACIPSHPKIRFYRREENGGQAAARNDGARLAIGEFLAFLDQDDLWEQTFLEETLTAFRQYPEAAVIHADGYQVNERNKILEYDMAMKYLNSITSILRGGHDTGTSASLIRKTCFESVGGYDETLAIWEDIDLGIRLSQHFKIIHLQKPLYRHRLYSRNVSRYIPSERALQARETFLKKHTPLCFPGSKAAKSLPYDWAQYHSDKGKFYLSGGKNREARVAFIQSLRLCPFSKKTILRLLRSFLPSLTKGGGFAFKQ
ncbi:MAG: glycosyltransferase [Nitrospirae bacterium]|nr:glycosyltransferase [Nitrospirota bacterium]